ncbi:hypothetical protein HLB44_07645 [Aquincola sp. S2]|uniref:Lipoprotein n=1 Tax=Pseudaquabacterium terrae TaxID=2732868 RepID=A0ABX2EE05_9BURK|nr:hypothetical protein [Aquabacterium terrae]NRF66852.1 hypothetical protein [Aquabacterium terrae]
MDSFTARRALALTGAAALLGTLLSACYVVPIDPRTGRPLPPHDGPHAHPQPHPHPQPQVVVVPPPQVLPAAPPVASVLQARLYPLNEQANTGGLLVAQVVDNHTGRGSISLAYRGSLLQGESTRVDGSHAVYGRIHREVLGAWSAPGTGRRGIANAYGAGGINAQCEYVVTGPSIGTGACLFSDGAKYQMHFGQ